MGNFVIADGGADGTRIHGCFDGVRDRVVYGWAWIPAAPERWVDIRVLIDGAVAIEGPATTFRSDLEQAGIADGRKGFELLLPLEFCDGAEHEVTVVAGDGAVLLGCLRRLVLDGSRACGYFDGLSGRALSGWAWIPAAPERQVSIRVLVDRAVAVEGLAADFRPDLEQAGIADGRKSFNLALPLEFCDGAEHEVTVVAEDGILLVGCPCRLTFPERPFMPIPPDPEPLPIELAICCIAKNEARHLLEWIAYHRVVGVEHFLVFDNESDDGTTEILNILAAKGVIDHVPWIAREDGASPQLSAFAEGVRRLRDRAKWTACIDLDQFLLPVGTDDVRSILRDFDDAAGLVVPRRVFGSQGEMEGRDDLVLRRFTRLAPGGQTQMGRSIVRARHVKEMGVHTPVLAQGSMVRLSDTGRLVINDYFCRSQGGYVEASAGYDRNEAESPEILRFEGRLREMRAALLQIINDGTVPDSYYHQARE